MAVTAKFKEAAEERAKLVHDARGVMERAEAEKRDMSAEEKQQFDAMMDKVDSLAQQMSQGNDDEDEEENDDDEQDEQRDELKEDERDEAGAAGLDEDKRDDDEQDDQRGRRDEDAMKECNRLRHRLLDLQTAMLKRSGGRVTRRHFNRELEDHYSGSGHDGARSLNFRAGQRYAKEYRHWLKGGAVPREYRDMSLGTNSAGGYLVTPTKLSEDIVVAINNLVFIRKLANIQSLTDAISLGNPQLTADIQPITWGNETTVSTADSSLTLGRRDLTPNMATNLILVTFRELQAAPRVEDLLTQRISLSFAYGEEAAYLTGDGDGKPLGLFTASASGIPTSRDVTSTGASHGIDADDLFGMVYNIPQQYQNAKTFGWIMHRNVVKQCVTLKDSNGQYLWNVSGYISPLTERRSDSLCGFPVYQSEFAPNNASPATGNYVAVLGDFAFYRIAETMEMEIQRLIELYAASGKIGFLARKFVDGAPVLPYAFSRLILA